MQVSSMWSTCCIVLMEIARTLYFYSCGILHVIVLRWSVFRWIFVNIKYRKIYYYIFIFMHHRFLKNKKKSSVNHAFDTYQVVKFQRVAQVIQKINGVTSQICYCESTTTTICKRIYFLHTSIHFTTRISLSTRLKLLFS